MSMKSAMAPSVMPAFAPRESPLSFSSGAAGEEVAATPGIAVLFTPSLDAEVAMDDETVLRDDDGVEDDADVDAGSILLDIDDGA